jgi:hypothetical protein
MIETRRCPSCGRGFECPADYPGITLCEYHNADGSIDEDYVKEMSYLNDVDHDWNLDPACLNDTDEDLLEGIKHLHENPQGYNKQEAAACVRTVLEGYEGLRRRHPEATVAQCFGTSMVWMYG